MKLKDFLNNIRLIHDPDQDKRKQAHTNLLSLFESPAEWQSTQTELRTAYRAQEDAKTGVQA